MTSCNAAGTLLKADRPAVPTEKYWATAMFGQAGPSGAVRATYSWWGISIYRCCLILI
jgi:hypothetical protein